MTLKTTPLRAAKAVAWLTAALLTAACSTDDAELEGTAHEGRVPMLFGWQMGAEATRADAALFVNGTALPSGQQIGVFGTTTATAQPVDWLFYNQPMTVDAAGSLSYEPLRYWPNTSGVTNSFWAYYPYSATHSYDHGTLVDQTLVAQQTGHGSYTLEFRQLEDASRHVDLMLSTPITGQAKQNKADRMTFTFRHMLAQVKLTVTVSGGGTFSKLTLHNVATSGLLNDCNTTTPAWTALKYGNVTATSAESTMLLVPQSTANTIYAIVEYTVGGVTKKKQATLNRSAEWEAGKVYTYNINVAA